MEVHLAFQMACIFSGRNTRPLIFEFEDEDEAAALAASCKASIMTEQQIVRAKQTSANPERGLTLKN